MDTPTGFRDYWPEEAIYRRELKQFIEKTFIQYGYSPMEESTIEFLNVLSAKSGDAIKKEIFKIEGEDIGLRFDLTVGFARAVASRRDLKKPFKRFLIDKVFRNEEAQRGRYREFVQADVDIVGVSDPSAEVELIEIAKTILGKIGIKTTLLINHRLFLNEFAEKNGFGDKKQEVFRIIDKLDKIGEEEVLKLLKEVIDNVSAIEQLLHTSDPLALVKEYSEKAYEELSFIIKMTGAKPALYLIRGFDYYTGAIFEFKEGSGLTVAGGGRYDSLLGLYGLDEPAVGIGIGFDRILALMPKKKEKIDMIYIGAFADTWEDAFNIAKELRKDEFNVDLAYRGRSFKKQIEYANEKGYKLFVIVGKKELEEDSVKVKDMESGEEKLVKIKELRDFLSSH